MKIIKKFYNKFILSFANLLNYQITKFSKLVNKESGEKIAAKPIKIGLIIMGIFTAAFFIWGSLAPINSASIASGKIVIDFNKKTIQHFEGGIIEEILVKESDYVVTDQPLMLLSNIQSKSQNDMVLKQFIAAKAVKQRLKSELNKVNKIEFSGFDVFKEKIGEIEIAEILQTQTQLFNARTLKTKGQYNILNKRIEQLNEVIEGLIAKKQSLTDELIILAKQEQQMSILVKNKNIAENSLLELQKNIAQTKGMKADITSQIGKNRKSILEIETEIVNFDYEVLNQIYTELQDIEILFSDLTEQLASTRDTLTRTVIKAPISGHIMDIKFHTKGAVIPPAGEIMYIVPDKEELIIEAKVNPKDIDNIATGQKAKVSLSAFKEKKVPKLTGKLISISADILEDEMSGEQYFLARIKLEKAEITKLKKKLSLYPGMPADVFRTLLKYIFSPIFDSTYKAFRED